MADISRKVCITVSKDCIGQNDGAQQISRSPRGRVAPDATDAIYQEVAKLMNFRRTDQVMDVYLMEFDVLREKADAKNGGGQRFPRQIRPRPMRGSPKMRNPWRRPVFAAHWRFQRRPAKCVDYLEGAGMRRGVMRHQRLIGTPPRRKRISQLASPIVRRNRKRQERRGMRREKKLRGTRPRWRGAL